jgi:hypothetical protein
MCVRSGPAFVLEETMMCAVAWDIVVALCEALICLDYTHAYKLRKISNLPLLGGKID